MRLSITASLAEQGHRLTGSRQALTDLIDAREGHFTAADLIDDARRRNVRVGRATVFRTLELLTSTGSLERLDLPSGDHAYVACAPKEHHHHVVCRRCGKSAEAMDTGLQTVVRDIGERTGYAIETHRLELYGLCPDCQSEDHA
jgi:Fur family transcriptional regulator, ferric uptake regulator